MNEHFELKRVRKNLGYNQALTASLIGVSQQFLSDMERGVKPLNTRALEFIEEADKASNAPSGMDKPKKDDLVVSKLLKTKEQLGQDLPIFEGHGFLSEAEAFMSKDLWQKWWFQAKNPMCEACSRECKQSSHAKVIACPQYEEANA